MEIFLILLVVAQSVATCLFFTKRWDSERSERIKERCEWEVRELELRKQLAEILAAQAAQINAANLHLEAMRAQSNEPPLVHSVHAPNPAPQERNGQNLVFFGEQGC